MANVNPLLEAQYRKRFWSGSVQADVSLTNEQEFDSDGENWRKGMARSHLR